MNMNRLHRWYCRSAHWRGVVRSRLLPWALAGVDLGDDVLEIGPGPGVTTDELRSRATRMTAVEVDPALAESLRERLAGTNVEVLHADGAALPVASASKSAVVCFTMLHHVPSRRRQDALLREAARVLKPGGTFAGSDSTTSWWFRLIHRGDTLVPVDPEEFATRLRAAGFLDVNVSRATGAFRFRARKAQSGRDQLRP